MSSWILQIQPFRRLILNLNFSSSGILWIKLYLKKKIDWTNKEVDENSGENDEMTDTEDDKIEIETNVSVPPSNSNIRHSVVNSNEVPYTFAEEVFTDTLPDIWDQNLNSSSEMEVEEPEFTCDLCDSVFTTKFDIESHMKLHIGKWSKAGIQKENQSDSSAKENSVVDSVHSDGVKQKIIRLVSRRAQKPKFACKFCDKLFFQSTDLELHVKTHKDKKAYICGTCGKMFVDNYNLKRHLNLHTKVKTYTCSICAKVVYNRHTYRDHLQSHIYIF